MQVFSLNFLLVLADSLVCQLQRVSMFSLPAVDTVGALNNA